MIDNMYRGVPTTFTTAVANSIESKMLIIIFSLSHTINFLLSAGIAHIISKANPGKSTKDKPVELFSRILEVMKT